MGVFRKDEGKTFSEKAVSQGWDIDRQIEELNKIYMGKVEFCRFSFLDVDYRRKEEKAICIKSSADDIDDLELPECEYIRPESLFDDGYEGKIKTIRLPECLERADIDNLGQGLSHKMAAEMDENPYINKNRLLKVVIRSDTECVYTEGCTIIREQEDGSVENIRLVVVFRAEHSPNPL